MSAYRFCRTDDIGLLVEALQRCWSPHFPDEPPMTPAAFKRSIRDVQVWCSSCMVAFAGADPIGVLIGAKRASATLVQRIAIHPGHQRRGHGRHLLASLGSKLAILGPPRIAAEVPEALGPACELFTAAGYVQEALLTDYVLERDHHENLSPTDGEFVIPVTVADLAANGLLRDDLPGSPPPRAHWCWERSIETLTARADEIAGLAVASADRIQAWVLRAADGQILALCSLADDGGVRLRQLLSRLGPGRFRLPKVHPAEFTGESLQQLGFRPASRYRLYSARPAAE